MNDPVLHAIGRALPQIGTKTKPSVTTTTGILVLGAATVVFGGDDAAAASACVSIVPAHDQN